MAGKTLLMVALTVMLQEFSVVLGDCKVKLGELGTPPRMTDNDDCNPSKADKHQFKECSSNQVISHIQSTWKSGNKDRAWKVTCRTIEGATGQDDKWTEKSELRHEKAEFIYDFGSSFLKGMASVHTGRKWVRALHKKLEDREFQFKYGGMNNIELKTNLCWPVKTPLEKSWTVNPGIGYVIRKIKSHYLTTKQEGWKFKDAYDRVWTFTICSTNE